VKQQNELSTLSANTYEDTKRQMHTQNKKGRWHYQSEDAVAGAEDSSPRKLLTRVGATRSELNSNLTPAPQ